MVPEPVHTSTVAADSTSTRLTLQMRGTNMVIQEPFCVDWADTMSLTDVINTAATLRMCVIVDPRPIRCDDTFASYRHDAADTLCDPVAATPATVGIFRIESEASAWLIDVVEGRFTQVDSGVDVKFLDDRAWKPLVAVCITPTRLTALGTDGTLTSAPRALLPIAA